MREAIAYTPDELKRYELLDQHGWEDLLRSMAAIDLCEAREWQRKPVRSDVGRRQPQRGVRFGNGHVQRLCFVDLLIRSVRERD